MSIASTAFAHRPYDRPAGTFKREDGTEIAVVRHYVDGIVFADPVSIHFRLPSGTNLAQTPYTSDVVVRVRATGPEVYQFSSSWIPIASRVDRFDGHSLHDVTSQRRLGSPAVHFSGHWVAYFVSFGLGLLLVRLYSALRKIPNRGWRMLLKWVCIGFVSLVGFFWLYDLIVLEPISPLIVLLALTAGQMALNRWMPRTSSALTAR